MWFYTNNMNKQISWTILYASFLFLLWGILLSVDPASFSTNPLGYFDVFFTRSFTIVLFFISFLLSIIAYKIRNRIITFLLLLPQQILLLLASFSGILSSIRGQYIDGVVRPSLFIFADQLPVILLAFIYGCAIYDNVLRSKSD